MNGKWQKLTKKYTLENKILIGCLEYDKLTPNGINITIQNYLLVKLAMIPIVMQRRFTIC